MVTRLTKITFDLSKIDGLWYPNESKIKIMDQIIVDWFLLEQVGMWGILESLVGDTLE